MDLIDAMTSNGTCREYRPDPVPPAVLRQVLAAAQLAPSGGNRQPVRFIVVTDPALRQQLKDWYLPHWNAYIDAARQGTVTLDAIPRTVQRADYFANRLEQVPALIVVCARLADCHATDTALGRLSVVGGASIYPAVQNLLLAARNEGLGTALTTLLCLEEPRVKLLLDIPDDIATAATVAIGYPAQPFPKRLGRKKLAGIAFSNRYGVALAD